MRPGRKVLLWAGLALLAGPWLCLPAVAACSCRPRPYANVVQAQQIVFEGRVLRMSADARNIFAMIEVMRPLRGSAPTRLEIAFDRTDPDCGPKLAPGASLTFAANFAEQSWHSDPCALAALNPAKGEGGRKKGPAR